MDTINKISTLKSATLSIYERKINALLSMCESEIERLFLINLIHYVISRENTDSPSFRLELAALNPWKESNPNCFVVDETSQDYFILKNLEKKGVIIYDEFDPHYYLAVTGFSFRERALWNGHEIILKILPQFEIKSAASGKKYRLDFAIYSYMMKGNELIQEYKICVECDGHEYHKTKEQRTNDGQRSRILQLDGWKVVRYTGSEIFATDKKNKRDSLIQELLQLSVQDHF